MYVEGLLGLHVLMIIWKRSWAISWLKMCLGFRESLSLWSSSYFLPPFHSQYISEGFASHLTELKTNPPKRAMYDVRLLTGEASFALPGKPKPEETSRRKPFGFSKRYQRSTSTDTQTTLSTGPKQSRSTIVSRQSPSPQTERNV